jgi:putative zinc finger protein
VNCLDAETLAAWFDGGLSGAALEDVRSHVAGCVRCQALVGAMGRTRAAAPAPEPERSPRWWLAWAVPAAAAATAVALWVAVPRPNNVAVNQSPASTVQKKDAQTQSTLPQATPAEPAPAAPPARAAAPVLQDRAQSADAAPPAAAPASENDAAKQAAANVNETLSLRAAAPAPTAAAERREDAERQGAVVGQLQARDAFPANPCGSPWPAPPPDVAGQITAGSSPSTDVCWIVGRAGTVLRSTDHQTWQRVNIPQAVDLSGVTATDARTARVVAADGRALSTSDGGVTWTQR